MSFHIRHATSQERSAIDSLTYKAWGQKLTEEQFLRRELTLRAHPWPKENLTTWVLTDDSSNILTSCETYRMTSRLEGVMGYSYGFASVFTDEAHRGKGYAQRLVEGIVEQLREAPTVAQGFILFSEVGPELYRRAGFNETVSDEWVFTTSADFSSLSPRSRTRAEFRPDGDIPEVLAKLSRLVEARDWPYQILPTPEQIDWHFERERFYAKELGRQLPPSHLMRVGTSFAIWMADYKNDVLRALEFVGNSLDDVAAILVLAQEHARELDLNGVSIWDSPLMVPENERDELWDVAGLRLRYRDNDIAMIQPDLPLLEAPRALWV